MAGKRSSRKLEILDKKPFPRPNPYRCIVVGASAGGVEALIDFFRELETTPNCTVIVALHISSQFPSALQEIIARISAMPVVVLSNPIALEPGKIFICPPGFDVELNGLSLELKSVTRDRLPHPNISKLFESCAMIFRDKLIAVVLSGSGTDGSMGVQHVKNSGGIVLAQNPETAKYSSMPDAARKSGVVDDSLSPQDLAHQINEQISKDLSLDPGVSHPTKKDYFDQILHYIRVSKGLDFTQYKEPALHRRILHRLKSLSLNDLDEYISYLKSHRQEVDELTQTLLISVTSFFRDPEVFEELRVLLGKTNYDARATFRVWVPSCCTGEEAFTLAILLKNLLPMSHELRIFATDIDPRSIEIARLGRYAVNQLKGMPAEAEKFIERDGEAFTFTKELRDCILFSVHDVLQDPPLIRVDLVSCRNLLIYLTTSAQEKLLRKIAFALNHEGILLLGKAENLGKDDNYQALSSKSKIYKVIRRPRPEYTPLRKGLPLLTSSLGDPSTGKPLRDAGPLTSHPNKARISQIERALLEHATPAAIIVDMNGAILESHGDLKPFISLKKGLFQNHIDSFFEFEISALIKSGLLRLRRERKSNLRLERKGLLLSRKVYDLVVNLHSSKRDFGANVLVVFTMSPSFLINSKLASSEKNVGRIGKASLKEKEAGLLSMNRSLKAEVSSLRLQLNSAIEDLESSNEQLQSMNEELQSTNEELQSMNEELESSNEELRATNEELIVVNEQNRKKTAELEDHFTRTQIVEDSIESCLATVSRNLLVSRCNSAAGRKFSIAENSSILDFLANWEPHDKVREFIEAMKRGQKTIGILKNREGAIKFSFNPIRHLRKDLEWGVIVVHDLTEELCLVQKLDESKEQLAKELEVSKSILDAFGSSVALIDRTGTILRVNKHWVDFGLRNSIEDGYSFIGKNYLTICQKSGMPEALELVGGILKVMCGEIATFSLMYPCHGPSQKRWFVVQVDPFFSPDGKIQGAVVSHHNRTELENYKSKYHDLLKVQHSSSSIDSI